MTNVPSFKEIWNAVPETTEPRTLVAADVFLNAIDHAIDLDNVKLDVWGALTGLVHELRELRANLAAMREGDGGAYRKARRRG